jgi:hypothetical protein
MLIVGLALFAITIVGLWICLPGKDSKMKPYLRGGVETLAAIAINAGLGLSGIFVVVGLARYY